MNNMKLPYFPLYVGDFSLGTEELTNAETGAYIRLLIHQWKNKSLPKQLTGKLVCYLDEWPSIEQYFPLCEDGRRRNPRLEEEREKITDRREKQSEGGKKSAAKNKLPPKLLTKQLPKTPPNIAESDPYSDSEEEPDKIKEVVDLLAQILPSFKFKLTPSRKSAIKARGKEFKTLADWTAYFQTIKQTPFLHGDNERGWKANIDWILKPANVAKVLEGAYKRVVKPQGEPVGKLPDYKPDKPLTAEEQAETDIARKQALEDVKEWGKKHDAKEK